MLDSAIKAFFALYRNSRIIVRHGIAVKNDPTCGIVAGNIAVAVMPGNRGELHRFRHCSAFFSVPARRGKKLQALSLLGGNINLVRVVRLNYLLFGLLFFSNNHGREPSVNTVIIHKPPARICFSENKYCLAVFYTADDISAVCISVGRDTVKLDIFFRRNDGIFHIHGLTCI